MWSPSSQGVPATDDSNSADSVARQSRIDRFVNPASPSARAFTGVGDLPTGPTASLFFSEDEDGDGSTMIIPKHATHAIDVTNISGSSAHSTGSGISLSQFAGSGASSANISHDYPAPTADAGANPHVSQHVEPFPISISLPVMHQRSSHRRESTPMHDIMSEDAQDTGYDTDSTDGTEEAASGFEDLEDLPPTQPAHDESLDELSQSALLFSPGSFVAPGVPNQSAERPPKPFKGGAARRNNRAQKARSVGAGDALAVALGAGPRRKSCTLAPTLFSTDSTSSEGFPFQQIDDGQASLNFSGNQQQQQQQPHHQPEFPEGVNSTELRRFVAVQNNTNRWFRRTVSDETDMSAPESSAPAPRQPPSLMRRGFSATNVTVRAARSSSVGMRHPPMNQVGCRRSGSDIPDVHGGKRHKADNGPVQRMPSFSSGMGGLQRDPLLPTVKGDHPDLWSISGETMCRLMGGDFDELFDSKLIFDCRYPYEYDGGHVESAESCQNDYRRLEELVDGDFIARQFPAGQTHRQCIVFYCEFSSQRGPAALRKLRALDRQCNSENYPALHYTQVYLLHGGYKAFFNHTREHSISQQFCHPDNYVEMLDPKYAEELKQCTTRRNKLKRNKSRSCLQEAECLVSPVRAAGGLDFADSPEEKPAKPYLAARKDPGQRHRGFSFAGHLPPFGAMRELAARARETGTARSGLTPSIQGVSLDRNSSNAELSLSPPPARRGNENALNTPVIPTRPPCSAEAVTPQEHPGRSRFSPTTPDGKA